MNAPLNSVMQVCLVCEVCEVTMACPVYLESQADWEKMADLVCLVHLGNKDVMGCLVTEAWMVYLDLQVRHGFGRCCYKHCRIAADGWLVV